MSKKVEAFSGGGGGGQEEEKGPKEVQAGAGKEKIVKKAVDPSIAFQVDRDKIPTTPQESAEALRKALLYRQVNLVGEDGENGEVCEYCGKESNQKPLPLGCETLSMSFLGAGFPLFFEYIKYCIAILLLLLVSSGSFNMFSNFMLGKECKTQQEIIDTLKKNPNLDPADLCHWSWMTASSLANKRSNQNLLKMQEIMNFLSVITIIVMLQFFRKAQREVDVLCDFEDIGPPDYSVLIKNLPQEISQSGSYTQALQNFLEKQAKVKVTKISLAYDYTEINQLRDEQLAIVAQKKQALQARNKTGSFPQGVDFEKLRSQSDEAMRQFDQLCDIYERADDKEIIKNQFTGWAFVSVQYQSQKDSLLTPDNMIANSLIRKLFKRTSSLVWNGNNLFVEKSPDPSDVFWENLAVPTKTQYIRRVLSVFITIITLMGCIGIIVGMNVVQKNAAYEAGTVTDTGKRIPGQNGTTQFLGSLVGILVQVTNFILASILKWSSGYESYSTRTLYNSSMATQTTIAMFFNTALINFTLNIVYLYFVEGPVQASEAIFKPQGLIQAQQNILITNAWMPVLVYMVDGGRIAKWVFQYLQKKKLAEGKSTKTQMELNELFAEPDYDIAARYPIIINCVFVAAFYAPLIPLALPYACFSLSCLYWAQKYKILRHRTIRYDVGKDLSVDLTELLELILPIYCASNIMFEFFLQYNPDEPVSISVSSIVGIIVGLVHMVLPMQEFNQAFCYVKEFPPLEESYEQSIPFFDTDFDMENPVTSQKARINKAKQAQQNQAPAQQ